MSRTKGPYSGVSGIYRIYRVDGDLGDEWIGQAANIQKRWLQHREQFAKGINSPYLQRAWDKYGADAFSWEVIEVVAEIATLDVREQYHLDTRNPQYNISRQAGTVRGMRHSPESRAKMSARHKEQRKELTDRQKAAYKARSDSPSPAMMAWHARQKGLPKKQPFTESQRAALAKGAQALRDSHGVDWTEDRRRRVSASVKRLWAERNAVDEDDHPPTQASLFAD